MVFKSKDIISITDFDRDDIVSICESGKIMYDLEKEGKRYGLAYSLKQKALAYMFYETSTRTKTSFNTAMRELGGQYDGFSGTEGTSVMKKETIRDTIMMDGANHFDVIVMRHPLDGSVQWAADVTNIPVINGGDGKNEHPTQALLDTLTIYMLNDKKLDRLNIGFGGDLSHGRTIRSGSLILSNFDDITIRWAAEDFFGMPKDLESLLRHRNVDVIREESVKDVIRQSDFYYMTRPQLERIKKEDLDKKEVIALFDKYHIDISKGLDAIPDLTAKMMQAGYRIDSKVLDGFDARLMHPLPVNSEVAEIDYSAYFSPCQKFFEQAEFGIFMRKAILYRMLKDGCYQVFGGKLDPSLEHGNNRLCRQPKKSVKEGMFIDNISDGLVIDHLAHGTAYKSASILRLIERGYDSIPADLSKQKSFLKTSLGEITERELKEIAKISSDPTINIIRDGKVIDKFVYLLCENDNCVSRAVNEDVPPKFYDDNDIIRCRYCRRPYEITNRKVSPEERGKYISGLPKSV